VHEALLTYGYVLVFLGTIIEGDATLLAAAFLAHQGHFNLMGVLLVAALATTLANEGYYFLARRHADRLPGNGLVDKVRQEVQRRGALLLFFSRFIFGLRIAIPAACGVTGMGRRKFLALNAAGAALWVGVLGLAGYSGGRLAASLWRGVREYDWAIACGLALAAMAWAIWRGRGRDEKEVSLALRRPDLLPVEALAAISEEASHPGVVEVLLEGRVR
jgi:membrane protein DedA with SNARE-associated domain